MFRVKQYMKMFLQNVFLPRVYDVYARKPIQKGLILFADAHHEEMPFSMRRMYEEVLKLAEAETDVVWRTEETESAASQKKMKIGRSAAGEEHTEKYGTGAEHNGKHGFGKTRSDEEAGRGYDVQVYVRDFNKMSYGAMLKYLVHFMKQYAVAEYVFICDYYLPVAACRKRPETKVVQLWHSCGLMKKIAYDTGQDIPENYKGNMFGNYTYLTLSAKACVQVHADALRIPKERIRATGVSRTDYYFDEAWNQKCRENFYRKYPQAVGKKIALWAPTFRGNAAHPVLTGLKEIRAAQEALSEEWYFILKAHPHIDAHGQVSNCTISTEELLCVADVLITDYSSVLFDYLIYEKPVVLFAPDLEEYESGRGFYIDYRSMPFPLVQGGNALTEAIAESGNAFESYQNALAAWKEKYIGACDGRATRRILDLIGLQRTGEEEY